MKSLTNMAEVVTVSDLHQGGLSYSDGGVALIERGEKVTFEAVTEQAQDLASKLTPYTRLGVRSQCVLDVLRAFLAIQHLPIDVVLLRDLTIEDAALAKWWQITQILEGEGNGRPAKVRSIAPTAAAQVEAVGGSNIIIPSSGTTGIPKLAIHPSSSLIGRIKPPPEGKVPFRWLLTYHPHSFAGLQVLLTAWISRTTLVVPDNSTMAGLVEGALQYRPTHISGTPTFWRAFINALGDSSPHLPLRQITLGGEAVDQGLLDRLSEIHPEAGLQHIYASTEAGAAFSVRDRRAGFPVAWLNDEHEGIQLRIHEGVLHIRSPRQMHGYLANISTESETDLVQSTVGGDGWIATNDLVRVEGDRVVFAGRKDGVCNIGGQKVAPEEVEMTLVNAPEVREVRVFGVKNPITGTVLAAEVVLDPSTNEDEARAAIFGYARAHLLPYQVPRLIKFVPNLAITPTGKKDRR